MDGEGAREPQGGDEMEEVREQGSKEARERASERAIEMAENIHLARGSRSLDHDSDPERFRRNKAVSHKQQRLPAIGLQVFLYALPPQARGRLPYQTPASCIENGLKRQIEMVPPFWTLHYFPKSIKEIASNKLQPLISIPFPP